MTLLILTGVCTNNSVDQQKQVRADQNPSGSVLAGLPRPGNSWSERRVQQLYYTPVDVGEFGLNPETSFEDKRATCCAQNMKRNNKEKRSTPKKSRRRKAQKYFFRCNSNANYVLQHPQIFSGGSAPLTPR